MNEIKQGFNESGRVDQNSSERQIHKTRAQESIESRERKCPVSGDMVKAVQICDEDVTTTGIVV